MVKQVFCVLCLALVLTPAVFAADGNSIAQAADSSLQLDSSSQAADSSPQPDSSSQAADSSPQPDSSSQAADSSPQPDSSSQAADSSPQPDGSQVADSSPQPDSSSQATDGDTVINLVLPSDDATIFDKPFDDYTVTESLLFLVVCLLLANMVVKAYEKIRL